MILAHKIALDPTRVQAQSFLRFAGCHRTVYNFLLSCWRSWWAVYFKAMQEDRAAEVEKPSWGILKTTFNALRLDLFPWLVDPLAGHRDCWSQPFKDLQAAYRNKCGGRAEAPRFKSKRQTRPGFAVANDKLQFNGSCVRLPKIGWVKTREPLRLRGKIMGGRATRDSNGRWFIAVQVEDNHARLRVSNKRVGVDLGIRHTIILSEPLSDGRQFFDAPKPLKAGTKRIKRLNQAVARKQKGSNRRRQAVERLGKAHFRIRAIRADWINKMTTSILRETQAIGIEDLHLADMIQNYCFASALSDVALREIRRQVEYKAVLYGTEIHVADRWYSSSKLCSDCGAIKDDLTLSDRTYRCAACGLVLNRDENAARNLTPGLGAGVSNSLAPRIRRRLPEGLGVRTQSVSRNAHL